MIDDRTDLTDLVTRWAKTASAPDMSPYRPADRREQVATNGARRRATAQDPEADEVLLGGEPPTLDHAAPTPLDDDSAALEARPENEAHAEDTAADVEVTPRRRRPRRLGRPVAWVRRQRRSTLAGAALIVLLVAVSGYLGWQVRGDHQLSSARHASSTAAKADITRFFHLNYQHLDQDMKGIEANATTNFTQKFKASSSAVDKALVQYKASSTGNVQAVGVISVTANKAVLLVYAVDNLQSTATQNKPTSEAAPLRVTMLHQHGRWLLDNIAYD